MPRDPRELATADGLLLKRHGDGSHELEDGVLLVREPSGFDHGEVVYRICVALAARLENRPRVRVAAGEPGFLLSRDPDTVRAPDIALLTGDHAARPGGGPAYPARAPDLAIEVRSSSDTLASQLDKGRMWISRGARLVWVIDPVSQVAYVLVPGASLRRVLRGGNLCAEPVLPGVEVSLSEVLGST
jgi:Uma2 family endonuclease